MADIVVRLKASYRKVLPGNVFYAVLISVMLIIDAIRYPHDRRFGHNLSDKHRASPPAIEKGILGVM